MKKFIPGCKAEDEELTRYVCTPKIIFEDGTVFKTEKPIRFQRLSSGEWIPLEESDEVDEEIIKRTIEHLKKFAK